MNIIEKGLAQQFKGYIDQTTDDLFTATETEIPPRRDLRALWSVLRSYLSRSRGPQVASSVATVRRERPA